MREREVSPSSEKKFLIAAATALRERVEDGALGDGSLAATVREYCQAVAEYDDQPIESRWAALKILQRAVRLYQHPRRLIPVYQRGGSEALGAAITREITRP